jgi:hypothetical protein
MMPNIDLEVPIHLTMDLATTENPSIMCQKVVKDVRSRHLIAGAWIFQRSYVVKRAARKSFSLKVAAVFLSDIHLQPHGDPKTLRLAKFIDSLDATVTELFLLGDIFDFWMGGNAIFVERYRPLVTR